MNTRTRFLDNLVVAVRDNPVAAALIGGGALWLVVRDERLKSATRSATAAALPMVDSGARNLHKMTSELHGMAAPPTAPEMDDQGSFRFGEMLRDTGAAASIAVSEAGEKMRDRFKEGVDYARESADKLRDPLPGKQTVVKTQSLLIDIFERQPLVLGAIGLAIGAAVAGAFHSSDVENKWIGEASDDVKADLNRRVGAVSESLAEASDALKTEFSDAVADTAYRIKLAGTDAAMAAREEMKSHQT